MVVTVEDRVINPGIWCLSWLFLAETPMGRQLPFLLPMASADLNNVTEMFGPTAALMTGVDTDWAGSTCWLLIPKAFMFGRI